MTSSLNHPPTHTHCDRKRGGRGVEEGENSNSYSNSKTLFYKEGDTTYSYGSGGGVGEGVDEFPVKKRLKDVVPAHIPPELPGGLRLGEKLERCSGR